MNEATGYLLPAAGEDFERPIRRDDIVWTYSGVRPLFDDGASSAREFVRDKREQVIPDKQYQKG